MKIRFANFIRSALGGGLLGCIEGFSFAPNQEAGFFTPGNEIHPKVVAIDFRFTPQHESVLGWDEQGNFLTDSFPYGQPPFVPQPEGASRSPIDAPSKDAALDPQGA